MTLKRCFIWLMGIIKTASDKTISEAALLLKDGDLVVIPTETVYGLAANALNSEAVAKIFKAKNRPNFNPLIVHVADIDAAQEIAEFNARALSVAGEFWPGALTLILKAKKDSGISDLVSAGLDTIAIRVPAHKVARALIKQAGVPIAAPSANASGEPSATTPRHVNDSLGENAPFILGAGACNVGLESTVLDLSEATPKILRPGAITAKDLEPYLGLVDYDLGHKDASKEEVKSPGQILKHYAPSIPVRLNAIDLNPDEALLAFGPIKFMGIKGGGSAANLVDTAIRNLSEDSDLTQAASNLFTMLRDLDSVENKGIAVMAIPNEGLGIAINDRLSRAAEG